MDDTELFDSPGLIWQGMSSSEIDKELERLQSRRSIIDRFVEHLKTNSFCSYNEYERFCDLMLTEGVNPNLWIDASIDNIDYEIEALIENANR
ncbi:hypothetical protein QUB75_27050 [Microcoleus sp. K1-B6]|uniref:hypothetical protein n=1 Tax=unclassified Microcoleus TaxID=2642155 RepID=UPI002FD1B256